MELYGSRLTQTPHPYSGPEGHYLSLSDRDDTHRMIFETEGGRVTSFRAGRRPEVEYIEGCGESKQCERLVIQDDRIVDRRSIWRN